MDTITEITPEMTEDGVEDLKDIVDFIEETGLTMHVLLAHTNPYRNKDGQQGLVHWSCKLSNAEDRYIIIYFSKGIGIRRWCQPPEKAGIPVHVPHDKIDEMYDGPMPPFESEQDRNTFNHCSRIEPPYLVEVLDILAKDTCLVEQTQSFNNWAQALKLNPDSMLARSAFEIICQQRLELRALLGAESYHKLLYEIKRLNRPETTTEENGEV